MRATQRILTALTGLSMAALVGACADAASAPLPTPTGPIDLVVLHTNDLWGETNPCG